MADRKISDLTALTTPASGDYLPIVDISEASAANKNKRITIEELLRGAPDGTAAAPGFAFESDGGNGFYLAGTDTIGASTNGVNRLTLSTSALTSTVPISATSFTPTSSTVPTNGLYRPAANSVALSTNSSERLRIDSSGRLLVGTSSNPSFSTLPGIILQGTAVSDPAIGLSRNVDASSIVSGNMLGNIAMGSRDGGIGALIKAEGDGTWSSTSDCPGRLVFSSTPSGSASPVERLRITSAGVLQVADAGNIAVGTTTGTKIGTATTQKLGFYNATPVVQPAAVADATDAATVITQLNDLLAKLRTLGIIAT